MLLTEEGEPQSFEYAKADTRNRKWKCFMQDKVNYLDDNHTYDMMELPKGSHSEISGYTS